MMSLFRMVSAGSMRSRTIAFAAAATVVLSGAAVGAQNVPAKKTVTTQADLPRFTYPVSGTAQAIVDGDAATFAAFAKPVRADVESTLSSYDIADHAALRGLLNLELDFQVLSDTEDAAALRTLAQIRDLQDKPDAKLTTGLATEALLKARIATGASSGDAFNAAFTKQYGAELAALPWSDVANRIKTARGGQEFLSAALIDGGIQADVEPALAKSHTLGNDLAAAVVNARYTRVVGLALRPLVLPALTAYVSAHDIRKPDIWAARDIVVPDRAKLTPVRIGIWDSGTDPSVYAKYLVVDPHPGPNNPHGIAFDLHGFRSSTDLYPLTKEQQQSFTVFRGYLKGLSDLQAAIDSPEAATLKAHVASLSPQQVSEFFETLELFSSYSHGSHVTGIAVRGNPAARVVVARITFDYKNVPTPPNEPDEARAERDYRLYVDYFKQHHVRVVNMSWGGTPNGIEVALEKNGLGKDAADRKAIARHYFDEDANALKAAIASAPDILFICAAGNSDSNTQFGDFIPSSFVLPNLIAVGAVDQRGDPASFTSYGPTVVVDADGFQVPSMIPGGDVVRFSGTSMASPNVVNLAAKLLAVDPKLTPKETIALIRDGATASADGHLHLINPKQSLQLLMEHMK